MSHGKCDWCGDDMPTVGGIYGGIFGGDYCSNKCKHDAEAANKRQRETESGKHRNDDYDDDDSSSLGFFGKLWRAIKTIAIALVVLTIIGYILDKDDDKKSDDNKKTVQTPTQTAKKQSTTTTKTTSSSSKTTAGSKPVSNKSATQSAASNSKTTSNQKSTTGNPTTPSSSNSSSVAPKNAAATTTNASAKSTTAEADISGEIYKALTDILESKGKSLKLNEAEGLTKGYESTIVVQMNQLRGTKYYNNALKEIMRCCPKYASEYSKNGKYFASEAEFYQSYISTDYSKKLKAKKKEIR